MPIQIRVRFYSGLNYPATNVAVINWDAVKEGLRNEALLLRVSNSTGTVIYKHEISDATINATTINVENWSPGVYFIAVLYQSGPRAESYFFN